MLPIVAARLAEHGRTESTEDVRAFLYELGVMLDDMFAGPDTNPAFPESLADDLDLAAVLIRCGHHRR